MTTGYTTPVANGIRTDHPAPGIPFVDDTHIPVADPKAIEAVGRNTFEGYWGREDPLDHGAWVAFTTDPVRTDLAWVIRSSPRYGKSVLLYRDQDASDAYSSLHGPALLFRMGGYWWDGEGWYRPLQVWDGAGEEYLRRPVPGATTVTAADLLQDLSPVSHHAEVQQVIDFDGSNISHDAWVTQLQLWARRRQRQDHPVAAVVNIQAPELASDQLVGLVDLAAASGIPITLLQDRATSVARDMPSPQGWVDGRPVWARVVVAEWLEQLGSTGERLDSLLATQVEGYAISPGLAHVQQYFSGIFSQQLNSAATGSKRWRGALPRPELASELAWQVAHGLRRILSFGDLAVTLRYAVLRELAVGQQRYRDLHPSGPAEDRSFYGIVPPVAKQLDWLIRADPTRGAHLLQEIVGEAERELGIIRRVTIASVETALKLDGSLPDEQRREFLARVFRAAAEGEDRHHGGDSRL